MKPSLYIILALVLPITLALAAEDQNPKKASGNIGKTLGDLEVKFIENKPEGDLTGKPMVVEFWATWCPPCRESIPHLNKLHQAYKDKGVVIIGISDEDRRIIKDFLKKTPIDYIVATDEKARLKKSLGVSAIPRAFLVDKNGTITWEGHPGNLKEKDLEKLLE